MEFENKEMFEKAVLKVLEDIRKKELEPPTPLLEVKNVGELEMLIVAVQKYDDGKLSLVELSKSVERYNKASIGTLTRINEIFFGKTMGV